MDIGAVESDAVFVLPIEWISIKANWENLYSNSVIISWKINPSTPIQNYEIKRSFDEVNFYSIVQNLDPSQTDFIDNNITQNVSVIYYKIRTTDSYRHVFYSPIIELIKPVFSQDIALFPNPTQSKIWLNFQWKESKTFTISLINNVGKSTTIPNSIPIDLSDFSKGIYSIIIQTKKGLFFTKQIIKE